MSTFVVFQMLLPSKQLSFKLIQTQNDPFALISSSGRSTARQPEPRMAPDCASSRPWMCDAVTRWVGVDVDEAERKPPRLAFERGSCRRQEGGGEKACQCQQCQTKRTRGVRSLLTISLLVMSKRYTTHSSLRRVGPVKQYQ